MSLRQGGISLTRLALGHFRSLKAPPTFKEAVTGVNVTGNLGKFVPTLCIQPQSISLMNAPGLKIKKEIIEPFKIFEKNLPNTRLPLLEITLPNVRVVEIADPMPGTVVEKKAARLIVIRRAKMKKHKWRKLQKKMKFVFAKKRQKRELKKEKNFQAVLLAQVKEAERFDAQEYVAEKLRTAHWQRPITRVRGFFAPDWVIRDHLREQENKRKLDERIQDCLRLKK